MIGAAHRQHARRGFTLLEILIVAMLITLFSGIAMFAVREMYEQNRYKAMPVEASQIGSALSFAFNDIGFYPRLHLLNQSLNTMAITTSANLLLSRPHPDTYGYYNATIKANTINTKWAGPYGGKSPVRVSVGQRATVKMHLVDIQTLGYKQQFQQLADINIETVDWPADTWGNPWMVYHVSKSVDSSGRVTYKLAKPDEQPDFLNAVVSYGANHVPGGNLYTQAGNPAYYDEMKTRSALYFEENPQVAGAEFVLRSYGSSQMNLSTLTSDELRDSFYFPGTADAKTGAVGMLQEGTDDIVWVF
ncbi:prepilin-type N-terminal cleavage/methylation domain-containing protein [bacterium]|nr:prepilin-type N-terminal cleavage/methylation domain-containing protein [bacterium]